MRSAPDKGSSFIRRPIREEIAQTLSSGENGAERCFDPE
jgi:hypothetical protein